MSFRALQPEGMFAPPVPFSQVVVSGDLVATAGQVPFDASGRLVGDDFRAQAVQVMDNLETVLAAAGCTLRDVFKVNCFVTDFADFPVFNEVYAQRFADPLPARSTIQCGLYGIKVEVEAWARIPS